MTVCHVRTEDGPYVRKIREHAHCAVVASQAVKKDSMSNKKTQHNVLQFSLSIFDSNVPELPQDMEADRIRYVCNYLSFACEYAIAYITLHDITLYYICKCISPRPRQFAMHRQVSCLWWTYGADE